MKLIDWEEKGETNRSQGGDVCAGRNGGEETAGGSSSHLPWRVETLIWKFGKSEKP